MYNRYILVAILFVASPAVAQFVQPSTAEGPACNERRDMTDPFFDTMGFREAHRSTLIQRMRTAQALTNIVASGDCSCEARFPDWDASIQYYLNHYAPIVDRHEIDDRTRYYADIINNVRTEARTICKSQGNW